MHNSVIYFNLDTQLLDLHPAPQYPDQVETEEDATEPETTHEHGLQTEMPTPLQILPSPGKNVSRDSKVNIILLTIEWALVSQAESLCMIVLLILDT